jgi:hypothetical protein
VRSRRGIGGSNADDGSGLCLQHGSNSQVGVAGRDQKGTVQIAPSKTSTGGTLTEEENELLCATARQGEFLVIQAHPG